MDNSGIDRLYQTSSRRIDAVNLRCKRGIYNAINWQNRLIGIKGPKGVGKSTLMLQHIKESFEDRSKVLYLSLDNLFFTANRIEDIVEYHFTHGGTHLFLDEIHRYKIEDWQTALKNIYDDYPDLKIVYSGSSLLQLDSAEGDLSRRLRTYNMHGLSFREFLEFENVLRHEPLSLDEILKNHISICADIASQIKVLPYFEKYLKYGYYPFYNEEGDGFDQRLQEVVRHIIECDIPSVEEVGYSTVQKAKKMLMILSVQVPFTPNMAVLYKELETNREQGLKILNALERSEIIGLLRTETKALKHLSSPDKIYLDNTNLMYAIGSNVDVGNVRETFFWNQLSRQHSVNTPSNGDFKVDGEFTFEVGGRKKSFQQIKDLENSYLAVDAIEVGNGNRIPLWLFGFLY